MKYGHVVAVGLNMSKARLTADVKRVPVCMRSMVVYPSAYYVRGACVCK